MLNTINSSSSNNKEALMYEFMQLRYFYLISLFDKIDIEYEQFWRIIKPYRFMNLTYNIISQFYSQASKKNIAISLYLAKKFPAHIFDDEDHMAVVLSVVYKFFIKNFQYGTISTYAWIESPENTKYRNEFREVGICVDDVQFESENELLPSERGIEPKVFNVCSYNNSIAQTTNKTPNFFSLHSYDKLNSVDSIRRPQSESKNVKLEENSSNVKSEKEEGTLKIKIEALGMSLGDYLHLHSKEDQSNALALAKSIVTLSKGTMSIDQNPSRICISLPVQCCISSGKCCCSSTALPDVGESYVIVLENDLSKANQIALTFKAMNIEAVIECNISSALEAIFNQKMKEIPIIVYSEVITKRDKLKLQLIKNFREAELRANIPLIVSTSNNIIRFPR